MISETYAFMPSQLMAYAGTAFELIPLHSPDALDKNGRSIGKAPCLSGWRLKAALAADEAEAHMLGGGNVGVRLRADQLVIDVDPRNGGDVSLKALIAAVGNDFGDYPTVNTGGGGLHIYMFKPAELSIITSHDAYPGVEFKTMGTQVVAAGSVHPNSQVYGWDVLSPVLSEAGEAPVSLLALIGRPDGPYAAHEGGKRSPEDLAELLEPLDPSAFAEHDRWFEVMAASHHATRGMGRQEFIDWSTSDPAYIDHSSAIGRRWDSLSSGGDRKAITEATLFKALHAVGRGDVVNRVTARTDFEEAAEDPVEASSDVRLPNALTDLTEAYVWIVDAESFVRREDTKRFTAQQFKSFHADRWPMGDILTAVWKGDLPIPKRETLIYLPGAAEFTPNGYNIWRDRRVKPAAGDVTIFLEHMNYMFPDAVERGYALDYLALLIQRPADKIHYALLVQGKQGTGKSWLGSLIAMMIGEKNVTRPSNSVVVEKFTEWQEGAQIAIIEELMALGRQEVANRLKPVITDGMLCIRGLYRKAYNTPNRLNLVCFTNHTDALPIEAGDRRWLVLFSPAQRADEAYYDRLFTFLDKEGPAAVAHWLGERQIGLNPKGVAPMTHGKAEMRGMSLGDAEQHLADLLESGAWPFDFGLVRLEDVLSAVPERIVRHTKALRNRVVKWLKEEVGALKLARYTKNDGRPCIQLWSIAAHDHWEGIGAAGRIDAFEAHSASGRMSQM